MKKSFRITLFINSLRGGGAEKICLTLANKLSESGYNIDLVVLNLDSSHYHDDLNPEVNLIDLKVKHTRNSFWKIKKYIKTSNVEKFLVFNHQLAIILFLIKNLFRFKYKIIARNISSLINKRKYEKSFWHKHIVHFFIKKFYRKVDLVIAQSIGMKKELITSFSIPKDKIVVINNPISESIYEFNKNIISQKKKTPSILFVGRLVKIKGFDELLEILNICVQVIPEIKLKIVGDGSEKKNIIMLAKKLNIESHIQFEGFQKNVNTYFLNSSLTILTSKYEGFPNVLLESIALGTPVVSFDCEHGPKEIIEEGINGYLIKNRNVNEMAQKILYLIQNPLDEITVKKTAHKFHIDLIIKQYNSCILSV